MYKESFEKLHPELIQSFLRIGNSDALSPEVQKYISILDKIPDLFRVYPNIYRCAREIIKLYPSLNLSFSNAKLLIHEAINHFHLNSSIKNEAWNQLYADRAEELHRICVKMGNMKQAKDFLKLSREWRLSKNENEIDVSKIVPIKQVISPKVIPKLLGLKEYNLKLLWCESTKIYQEACKQIDSYEINSEEKEMLKDEVRLNLNISDVDPE